jgi:hypothetical protein
MTFRRAEGHPADGRFLQINPRLCGSRRKFGALSGFSGQDKRLSALFFCFNQYRTLNLNFRVAASRCNARMVFFLRFTAALLFTGFGFICLTTSSLAQSVQLPEAPQPSVVILASSVFVPDSGESFSATDPGGSSDPAHFSDLAKNGQPAQDTGHVGAHPAPRSDLPLDANGMPIPFDRQQPRRILGFMPNFRSVSGGAVSHPPGWKYNFTIATQQSTDYSSFIFLGITSLTAEGMNMHPDLGKGMEGFYEYTWRGFLDKTDGTYLSAWLLPSLLHEDTRFYAMGKGHSIPVRSLYVISRQAVALTYGGRQTPNIAGLGGKVLTQVFSRYYYPSSAAGFNVLATKFSYSVMRDVAVSAVREFYPDAAAHFVRRHREKAAQRAARDASPTR